MSANIININFSKNAYCYNAHSSVQEKCADRLISIFPDKNIDSILEIGCGTGNFTEKLFKKYGRAEITALDISEKMLDVAEKRKGLTGVKFLRGDGENLSLDKKFDIITANACFQWFKDLESSLKAFLSYLNRAGSVVFSIYGNETFLELQEAVSGVMGKEVELTSKSFFSFYAIRDLLKKYFSEYDIFENRFEVSFPSLLDLLRDIKYSGTRGYGIERSFFIGRERLSDIEDLYIRNNGTIIATHQVFFCMGKK